MAGSMGFRNQSVNQSHFAMIPRADIPRSRFSVSFSHKTTFDAGRLIPIYCEEVLPGDTFNVSMTGFARMATPVFPLMDNLHLDSFFFFVPNRLVWDNWVRMMGEQRTPDASIDFTTPQVAINAPCVAGSIFDYFGIPGVNQVTGAVEVNALPFRAYELIYNEWFRDENLMPRSESFASTGDGPDPAGGTELPFRRGKRHDYFTSALPWPQKGAAVSAPLTGNAPISGLGVPNGVAPIDLSGFAINDATGGPVTYDWGYHTPPQLSNEESFYIRTLGDNPANLPDVFADLSGVTAYTINSLRQAFQIQRLLERDARGGTRYTELLLSHFGVQPQDARLQRPEYLGGGTTSVNINPIAQTSATGIEGGDSPIGSLGAVGTGVARHGFSGSFTEHGFIIGIINVRADLTYQQGLHRMWSRQTRYDYYWPVFAHLGEQAVLRKEIFFTGDDTSDNTVFGYQERWAEYRYHPSMVSGLFRSTATGNIDEWHAAQLFGTAPTLGATFISENPPMERILAAGELAAGQQFLFDSLFSVRSTRAMPTYSVPGFIDRF